MTGADRREYMKAWQQANKDAQKQYRKRYNAELRRKALSIVGFVCTKCGYADERALCLDHIFDDGAAHRKEMKTGAAYYWIINNPTEAVKRLQTLCANCNQIKAYHMSR
jgi:ribosomal protein S27AE